MLSYSFYKIDIPQGKTAGEIQTLCPQCSHTRKKKTDKCLSVNLDKKAWICHHCGWKGAIIDRPEVVKYETPEWKNNTALSDKVLKWFESRRITAGTLNKMQITEQMEWMPQINKEVTCICFNYFENTQLVNVKYRDAAKHFKMHKGAELIPYNVNCLPDAKEVWIVEGEMDALSLIEAGIENVVSVPNGAQPNLTFFDRFMPSFDHIEKIHIAVDNDAPGIELRNAIAERFGKEKCNYIVFDDCKDANEYLLLNGAIALREAAYNFVEFPMIGVFGIADYYQQIENLYNYGLPEGCSTGIPGFDRLLKFHKGYLTTITGIPGHGKSDFLDHILLKLLQRHGWKGAFYSPENRPVELHISKMLRKVTQRPFMGRDRMNQEEVFEAITLLENNIFFVKPEKDFTLDSILGKVAELKNRKNIDWFVIDAWNKLEHQYSESETKYIGQSLDKIVNFCERYNVHCFLVAHPRKIVKRESGLYDIPTLYDIAGSANFFNKTDNGITVYRNFAKNTVEVHIQKVKFSHWGEIGMQLFNYDIPTGLYIETSI
jgi:twinkle protein